MLTRHLLASLFAALTLFAGCARREKTAKTPVVETVRTPDSPTPPAAARDLADVMTSTLRLSADQTVKIREIFSSTVEQVNAARQKFPAKSAALNAELRRINTASETQLRTTLGAASYQEFQSKKRQIQAEMQQRTVK
jgi:hypothetical protein